MTTADTKTKAPGLNDHPGLVLWFDDLGSGNEQYRFLSNFYEGAPITLPGVTWEALWSASLPGYDGSTAPNGGSGLSGPIEFLTGEHAFAAMKFWGSDWTHFRDIVEARDTTYTQFNKKTKKHEEHFLSAPNHAKSLGRSRQHPLREDWEEVKWDVMCAVTRAKYTLVREEGQRLLDTGDKMLVEGTWWYDDVWGVDLNAKGLPGRNWLGTILMARRAELRAMQMFDGALVNHLGSSVGAHNSVFSI